MAGSDLPHTDSVYCYKDNKSDANKNPTENEDEDCKVAFIINMDSPAPTDDDDTGSEPEAERYQKFHKHPSHTIRPPVTVTPFDRHLSTYLSISKALKQLSVALSCLILAVIFNLTVLSVIHERVPDTKPLPDVAFSLLPKIDWALDLSEYIIMFITTAVLIMIGSHRYRSILIRRLALILSILYVFRGICMAVTQLPVANPQYYCSPKLNVTSEEFNYFQFTGIVLSRVTHLSLGMGLSVNGRHSFCGDYIFSGHTLILVISYLFIREYWLDNNRIVHSIFYRLLRYFFFLLIVIGVTGIVVARGHYMIDIILAYYISTRVFILYHKACDDIFNQPNIMKHHSSSSSSSQSQPPPPPPTHPVSIVIHNNDIKSSKPTPNAVQNTPSSPTPSSSPSTSSSSSSTTPSHSSSTSSIASELRSRRPFYTTQRNRLANSLWWFAIFRFVESDTIRYRIPIENHFDFYQLTRKALKKSS